MKLFSALLFAFGTFTACSYAQQTKTDTTATPIYNYVEQMPVAKYDIMKFISENVKYPEEALKNDIEGRIILKFIVNEDGSIGDVSVTRGIGGGCDEEAVRVMQLMPKWQPGKQNGKPVKVYFTMPITFRLETPAPAKPAEQH